MYFKSTSKQRLKECERLAKTKKTEGGKGGVERGRERERERERERGRGRGRERESMCVRV